MTISRIITLFSTNLHDETINTPTRVKYDSKLLSTLFTQTRRKCAWNNPSLFENTPKETMEFLAQKEKETNQYFTWRVPRLVIEAVFRHLKILAQDMLQNK